MTPEPVAKASSDVQASDLIATLRDRAPRLAMALAAGQMAWPAVQLLRGKARDRSTYTVKVPGADDVYDDLHAWVLGLLPSAEQRALVAWSSRSGMLIASPDDRLRAPEPPALRLRYDGTREQVIMLAGHKVKVLVAEGNGGEEQRWRPPEIIFTASSAAGRDALLAEIRRVLATGHDRARKPSLRMLDKWGDWERLDDLPGRDLDSVILPPGQIERLTADVGQFLGAEREYLRRCVPWHRGYLFEGKPGTGKTSVARAIATHFGMDVWWLPLADVKRDGELLRLVNRVGPRSMLLLEDVDVFHAATQRDDDKADGVTLSGLLNALDGIATPHGLVTVLTTNIPEMLDDAVIREGRVDLIEHFELADTGQVSRLVGRWYGTDDLPDLRGLHGIAPAAVIEACKQSPSADAAIATLLAGAGIAVAA